jgi:NADH-quinone oxidoreductase subunit H
MPRLRMDQLMNFAWKFMLPFALVNLLAAGLWRFLAGPFRWLVCVAVLLAGYALLGGAAWARNKSGKRTYRYAE